ncbi:MAG TPA: anhydro-N-acetylmuramic acid kinase [Caulobacteraceae bacterium]|jgi:anhydro-N-acetylmuramic acid kinase|nr:anhydro-N-acetylmuramic acid kinase [Caulobacteraceae bacterium]
MRVLGFMSGTSLDAVDMAVLETDGEAIMAFGPAGERKLSDSTRALVLEATAAAKTWARGTPAPPVFTAAAEAVADEHFEAAHAFLAANALAWPDLDLIGFHGQTVLHERPVPGRVGRTVQLGDGQRLATRAGVPVAFDFRTADVAAGGEGAPLAPVYHAARAVKSGLEAPVAVLNLGGVANITLISEDGALTAFDTGPANGMIDLLVQARTAERFDRDGRLAMAGRVDPAALERLLAHPYFALPGPKSLDRYDFSLGPVEALSLADAAATLTAFTAETVALGVRACPQAPRAVIACGGGRHNPALVREIEARLDAPVMSADDLGWRGDSIEAEAFAYLAARTVRGLPISFPGTTRAPAPMTGGRVARP